MKVSLFSLLALASSAWAKDSTVVNKGSNRNRNLNKYLGSTTKETPGGKAGKSDVCNVTAPAERAFALGLFANALTQLYGALVIGQSESDTEQLGLQVLGTFILWVGNATATLLESMFPGIVVASIDSDGNGQITSTELTVALMGYYEGECIDHLIVADGERAPFFGFMGVTSALVFDNIGAAYGAAKFVGSSVIPL